MTIPFPAYRGDGPYIFVCYSHRDSALVFPELQRLRERGLNLYYDEGISPGHEWTQELADAIDGCMRVLFFVSPASVASRHCRNEVQYALEKNKRIISVHLIPTELPGGLQLSLGSAQAVLKYDLTAGDFGRKLSEALESVAERPPSTSDESSARRTARMTRRNVRTIVSVAAAISIVLVAFAWWFSRPDPEPGYSLASRDASLRAVTVGVEQPEDLARGDLHAIQPRLLAESLVEALIDGTPLTVVPRYGDRSAGADQQRLDYLLRSSVTTDPDPLLHLELVATDTGIALWVDDLALDGTDASSAIARAASVAHLVQFTIDTYQMQRLLPFSSEDARALWLRAHVANQVGLITGETMPPRDQARLLERAIELDPESPMPHARLAELYSHADWLADDFERSRAANQAAERALALAPDGPWVNFSMGVVKRDADRDFAAARHYFQRARQLNWSAGNIELHLGLTDRFSGNLESAVEHFEASVALGRSYTEPWVLAPLAATQLELGRFEEAEKNLERWEASVSESNADVFAPWSRVALLARRGELDAAGNLLDEALRSGKALPEPVRAGLLALVGRSTEARNALDSLEARYSAGERFHCIFAFVAAFRLGERDRAFEWLDRAIEQRQSHPMLYGVEFDPIRDHPRFKAALEKIDDYTIRYE